LTTAANPAGGGAVTAGGWQYAGGTVGLLATPAAGYAFANFSGDLTGSVNHQDLAMNGTKNVVASFQAITKVTPTIIWPAPAAITYGGALSATQLDATASVPGAFVYNPAAGAVLPAGAGQTLSVTFTPTDTADYIAAAASTTITVNPAAPPSSPVNLVVTKVLTRSGGNVVVQLTIANTGRLMSCSPASRWARFRPRRCPRMSALSPREPPRRRPSAHPARWALPERRVR
jgi:hypothetical protein